MTTITWKQFYELFNYIVEKHFPDDVTIEQEIDTLHYILGDILEFRTAYQKWNEYQKLED